MVNSTGGLSASTGVLLVSLELASLLAGLELADSLFEPHAVSTDPTMNRMAISMVIDLLLVFIFLFPLLKIVVVYILELPCLRPNNSAVKSLISL